MFSNVRIGRSKFTHLLLSEFGESTYLNRIKRKASIRRRFYSEKRSSIDMLGTWDNRIDLPILLQTSIKHGKPIPKIALENCVSQTVIGRRTTNEDRLCMKELDNNLLYFAVFDGHGGSGCADFCSQNLELHIRKWLERGERDLQKVSRLAFQDVNDSFTSKVTYETPRDNSGSTCTVCLLRNSVELVISYVGDSRAILCRNGMAKPLTVDHVPHEDAEMERILSRGGSVDIDENGRSLVNQRLAMSRSLGDLDLKSYGVIATPDTASLEVKHHKDNFLVLTTDGITVVMSDKEICKHISNCQDAKEAANLMCDLSLQYSSEDNISVIVVPFGAWGKVQSKAIAIDGIGRYMALSSRYS